MSYNRTMQKGKAMVKFEDIKVGDIVTYDGELARVLRKDYIASARPHPSVRIIGRNIDVNVHPSDLQLIESVQLPQFKVGDLVHVNDVPEYERDFNGDIWVPEMADCIGKDYPVTELWRHSRWGDLVKLDGWWFRAYHLSDVNQYDIV